MAKDKKWYQEELEKLEEQNSKRLEEMGYKPALKLVQGATDIDIDERERPREVETEYGKRMVFVLKEPTDQSLMCSPYLYEMVVQELVSNGGCGRMTITRVGEGKSTRYAVKTRK